MIMTVQKKKQKKPQTSEARDAIGSDRRPVGGETRDSEDLSPGRRSGLHSSSSSAAAAGLSTRLFGLTNAEAGAASPLNTVAHSFSFCSSHGLKIAPPPPSLSFSASPFT